MNTLRMPRITRREIAVAWQPASAKVGTIARVNLALADIEARAFANAKRAFAFVDAGLPTEYKRTAPLHLAARDAALAGMAISLSWYALGTFLR